MNPQIKMRRSQYMGGMMFRKTYFTRTPVHGVFCSSLCAFNRLEVSGVMINDHTAFRTDWMPFVARRESATVSAAFRCMRETAQEKMRVFRYRT